VLPPSPSLAQPASDVTPQSPSANIVIFSVLIIALSPNVAC